MKIKNISFCIAALFVMSSTLNASESFYRGYSSLSFGFQWKLANSFHSVYGYGLPSGTLEIGGWLTHYLALGLKGSYGRIEGKTRVLERPATFQQVPLIGYLKLGVGNRLKGYISGGAGCLFYHEKCYLGTVHGQQFGWEGEVGGEYNLSPYFYALTAFRYLYFEKHFKHGNNQQLGGLEFRAGLGVRF